MKKNLWVFSFFLLVFSTIFFSSYANALSSDPVYVIKIDTGKIEFNSGETIKGSVSLENFSTSAIGDLFLNAKIFLADPTNTSSRLLINVKQVSDSFTLLAKESSKKEFEYKLPENMLSGTYGLEVEAINGRGEPLGFFTTPFKVNANNNFVLIDDHGIKNGNDFVSPLAGINFKSGENPEVVYKLENKSDKKVSVYPVIRTYTRNIAAANVVKEEKLAVEAVNSKEVKNERITVTGPSKPETYLTEIIYYEAETDKQISNTILFRWVIEGENARVISTQADKSTYQEGETAIVSVKITGPAAMNHEKYRLGKGEVTVDIFNDKGEVVGSGKKQVEIQSADVAVNVLIKKYVANPKIKAAIVNDGKVLDSYEFSITSDKVIPEIKREKTFLEKIYSYILIGIIVVLVIAILISLFVYSKNKKIGKNVSLLVLFISSIGLGLIISIGGITNAFTEIQDGPAGEGLTVTVTWPRAADLNDATPCQYANAACTGYNPAIGCVANGVAYGNCANFNPGDWMCYTARYNVSVCSNGVFFGQVSAYIGANDASSEALVLNNGCTNCLGAESCEFDSGEITAPGLSLCSPDAVSVAGSPCCTVWDYSGGFRPDAEPSPGYTQIDLLKGFEWWKRPPATPSSCSARYLMYSGIQCPPQVGMPGCCYKDSCSKIQNIGYCNQMWLLPQNPSDFHVLEKLFGPRNVKDDPHAGYAYSQVYSCFQLTSNPIRGWRRMYSQLTATHWSDHWHWNVGYEPVYINTPPNATTLSTLSTTIDNCSSPAGTSTVTFSWPYNSPDTRNQSSYEFVLYSGTYDGATCSLGGAVFDQEIAASVASGGSNSLQFSIAPTANYGARQLAYGSNICYGWKVRNKDTRGNWSIYTTTDDGQFYTRRAFLPPKNAYPRNSISSISPNPNTAGSNTSFVSGIVFYDGIGGCSGTPGAQIGNPALWYCTNWTFQDGTPSISHTPNPFVTFSSGGTKTINLQGRDSSNYYCPAASGTITITQPHNPTATFSCSPASCSVVKDASLSMINNSTDPINDIASSSWAWKVRGASDSTYTSIPFCPMGPCLPEPAIWSAGISTSSVGNYTARLIVTDAAGNSSTATKDYSVTAATHKACQTVSGLSYCQSVAGGGADTCTTDASCRPSTPTASISGSCDITQSGSFTLTGTAGDSDGSADISSSVWKMDGTTVKTCTAGVTSCVYTGGSSLSVGTHTATFTVTDLEGHTSAVANKSCVVSASTHKACQTVSGLSYCQSVSGAGADTCTTDGSCRPNGPIATFSCSPTGCSVVTGNALTLVNNSTDTDGSADISTSQWSIKTQGTPDTNYVVKKTYSGAQNYVPTSDGVGIGNYTARLVITDLEGHTSNAYKDFWITAAPTHKACQTVSGLSYCQSVAGGGADTCTTDGSCRTNTPTASISGTCNVTSGTSFTLTGTAGDADGSGDISSSEWKMDGTSVKTCGAGVTTCTYSSSSLSVGTHTATFIVTDLEGHTSSTASQTCIISPTPATVSASITCSPASCSVFQGEILNLINGSTSVPAGNVGSSKWYIRTSSGSYSSTPNTSCTLCNFTPQNSVGSFEAKLVVKDITDTNSSTAFKSFEIKADATADFACKVDTGSWGPCNAISQINASQVVTFRDNCVATGTVYCSVASTGGSINSRVWKIKGVTQSACNNNDQCVYTASEAEIGNFAVKMTITDTNGRTKDKDLTLKLYPPPIWIEI